MRFDTVFFDSGGTLYSDHSHGSAPSWGEVEAGRTARLEGALRGMGYQASAVELQAALAATKDDARLAHGRFYSFNHWIEAALARLELPVWPAETVILTDAFLGPRHGEWIFPGTVETIARLHEAGVYMGVIANTHWPGHTMHRHFASSGLARFFSVQVYSCEVGFDKPDPAIFRVAEQRSGRSAANARILYVGDTEINDVGGAHGVGWQAAFRRPAGGANSPSAEFNFEDSAELLRLVLG